MHEGVHNNQEGLCIHWNQKHFGRATKAEWFSKKLIVGSGACCAELQREQVGGFKVDELGLEGTS